MEIMKKCSNCKTQTENGKIVWLQYKNQTHIKYLCKKCIENLKNDSKLISYEIKN